MMRNQLAKVTQYLADLTQKLTKLPPLNQKIKIEQFTRDDSFIEQNFDISYKKKDEENYLEYFQRVLKNPLTYQVKLLKPANQQFCLCQDLSILVAVSNNPNKLVQKVLEQFLRKNNLYQKNSQGHYIKRPLKKVLERYQFLKSNIQQEEIKSIIRFIEQKGLQKQIFIYRTSEEEYNLKGLNIKISFDKIQTQTKSSKNKKNNQLSKHCLNNKKRLCFTNDPYSNYDANDEESLNDLSQTRKKRKSQKQNDKKDIFANIFSTPQQKKLEKKETQQPQAPKKVQYKHQTVTFNKEQNKIFSSQHENSEQKNKSNQGQITHKKQQEQSEDSEEAKKQKKRKFIRMIDQKKDVAIKQEENQDQYQAKMRKRNQISANKVAEKDMNDFKGKKEILRSDQNYGQRIINIQTPRVSQFVLYPKEESNTSNNLSNDNKDKAVKQESSEYQQFSSSQKSVKFSKVSQKQSIKTEQQKDQQSSNLQEQQQRKRLQNILKEYVQKTKHPKMRILKYLDSVSGDMDDLKEYLETNNQKILWKRVEDAMLRKFVKQQHEINSKMANEGKNINSPMGILQQKYKQLLEAKSHLRIQKRINYLNLSLV